MKIYIYTLILFSLLLSGCYKDKNNYTTHPINESIIKTGSEVYAVEQLTELAITPEISSTMNTNDNYSYEWKIFVPKEKEDYTNRIPYGEVIATTKDLKETIYAPAGNYILLYTITNNKTGVRNFKELKLTVNSAFYEGLVVAYDKNEHAELGFIRKDGQVLHELIELINGKKVTGRVQKVTPVIVKSVRLLGLTTTDNHYQIDADEFKILRDKSNLFTSAVSTFGESYFGANKLGYYDAPSDILYINQGKLYADMGPDWGGMMLGQYSQAFFYTSGSYQLFPFAFNGKGESALMFYDNLNKKFLRAGFGERELNDVVEHATDNFNPATINKKAVAAMLGAGDDVYYIMEDGIGRYVYVMSQYSDAIASRIVPVNLTASPDFIHAKVFDARTDQRQIYYAVDNKLYLYDLDLNNARVVLTLASGEEISDINVYRANMLQNSTDADFDKRIYIATNNGNTGKIYQYQIQGNGTIADKPEKEFNGFGKIVSITYRNPNE